jgi:hypothetical protein
MQYCQQIDLCRRRAGIQQAITAIAAISRGMAAKVNESLVLTANRRVLITRVSANGF